MKISISQISRCSDQAGFTLLELLVTVSIVAIVGVLAGTWVAGYRDRLGLARSAATVQMVLSKAALRARQEGRDTRVDFDASVSPVHMHFEGSDFSFTRELTVRWVSALEVGGGNDRTEIVFFGAGGASGGKLRLAVGAQSEDVEVSWLTGAVHLGRGSAR